MGLDDPEVDRKFRALRAHVVSIDAEMKASHDAEQSRDLRRERDGVLAEMEAMFPMTHRF